MKRPQPSIGRLTRTRKEVFERDSWKCQECKEVFLPASDDERRGRYAPTVWRDQELKLITLELGHIIPWQAGGLFHPSNLRALCTTCNRSEGRTAEHSPIPERITLALNILTSRPANESTVVAAINALSGVKA